MDKMKMESKDRTQENFERLAALFPNAVTETIDENGVVVRAIDKDVLQQEISAMVVEGRDERYQFTWPDKKKSILAANAPIRKTLRPCREESVNFDSTENLYIEGDNLDVLKLLQETYLGKVKMIYIDPPYNTGHDFVYNDDFKEDADEYLENSGQLDDDGNRLFQNTESNGRFHTDWLNMLYPRLKIARDLLSDDGVIFISIDDNEHDNVKKICDEVFGACNFVADLTVVNNLKGRNDKKYIARANDRVVMYVKSQDFSEYGLDLGEAVLKEYTQQDELGKYRLLELRKRGGPDTRKERPNMYYPFYVHEANGDVSLEKDDYYIEEALPIKSNGIDGRWRWGRDTALKNISFLYGKRVGNKFNIYEKDYLESDEGARRIRPKSVLSGAAYSTDIATKEYRALMDNIEFSNPKPIAFLSDIITYATNPQENAIILDFFSGSATTAHAVAKCNAQDGGNRKFIMVQLPEPCDEKSEAYKAGYKTVSDIGKERIRRAGAKIQEENDKRKKVPFIETQAQMNLILNKAEEGHSAVEKVLSGLNHVDESKSIDTGFRVLKLDSTNMKDVYYNPHDVQMSILDELADNIKEDRTPEDLLFQVMLDLGILLSSKIEESEIAGKKVFSVADNFLIACFDDDVSDETITAVAKSHPAYFVMRDSSMKDDSVATNFDQIFATYSPDTVRKVI